MPAMPLIYYPNFAQYPKLHSEIGMPTIPSAESVRAMMPERCSLASRARMGSARFLAKVALPRGENFMSMLEESYGGS